VSLIEPVWDAQERLVQHHVPVLFNIQQLSTAIKEELDNIPQATINSLINSIPSSKRFLPEFPVVLNALKSEDF
jgi:hypothetical protein